MRELVALARGNRIKYILGYFLLCVFVVTLRLFYLQIESSALFSSMGERNFLRIEIVPPRRGDVYDCKNVLLAANRPLFDLYWHGGGSGRLSVQDENSLHTIGTIVGIDFLQGGQRVAIEYAQRYARRLILKEDLSFQQLCQISEQCGQAQHIVIANRFKRVYPNQCLASHVLGYLNRSENIGQTGVEHHFDQTLQGAAGYISSVINATGKTLAQKISKNAKAGADVVLTLDFKLQCMAESLFDKEQSGALILMDPSTGAIRTLVSFPHFDPNAFLKPLTEEAWHQLSINNPLLNRATNAQYPPASTFKLVTLAAGLEEKIVHTDDKVLCSGHMTFCGRPYYCMKRTGHGKLTMRDAMAVSCNIPCFYIAKKIPIDRLAAYAHKFGLGRKTAFSLPEKPGLVPTTRWKRANKGEAWWTGESLSTCIGQGYLLATPLQVVRMVGAIGTGYLVKPRMHEDESIDREPLDISSSTINFLRSAMHEAAQNGTCRAMKPLKNFVIHAKTGTAQTCSLSFEKVDKRHLEHAWLSCYFSYKGQPPLALVVLVENAGYSWPAINIAIHFLKHFEKLNREGALS